MRSYPSKARKEILRKEELIRARSEIRTRTNSLED